MTESQTEDEQGSLTSVTVVDESNSTDVPNLKGDWHNIFVLLLLYTIQGIGASLTIAVPIILQGNKNVTYKDQALISLSTWPNSLKMMWAPLVDAIYIQKVGRRKSWLLPVQFLIGGCFIYMGMNIEDWIPADRGKPNILKLLYPILFIQTLVATQFIVIDSWVLTMLKKNNMGYGSTCSLIGIPFGALIGSLFLVGFTSENFCNKYLRFTPDTGGITTMPGFFYFCGFLFILISILIGIFKKEKHNRLEDNYMKFNIIQYYTVVWDILKLPNIRVLASALMTVEIGFASSVINVWILQLIDAGVPKDNVVVIHSSMIIVKVIAPIIISKYTVGPNTMNVYLKMSPIRAMWNITFVIFIYYITKFITTNGKIGFPIYFYVIIVFLFIMNNILGITMRSAKFTLFNRISDPRFGGTYMALLNTFSNIGISSSTSLAISMIDFLTFKECSLNYDNNCSTSSPNNTCKTNGSSCIVTVNGYYVESALCIMFGIGWYYIFRGILKKLQVKSPSHWMVNVKNNKVKKNETAEYKMVEKS
ncbi:acetyl-coenzyme A transporter 1-like [Rhopalosiphum maidis]|uniref:acetyl-coenzyme A transporter 1-like n=1 Tax=Rhopalosiphum maidis TaxID=43146 RepID=UPI000EFE1F9C|nr:acetyl-coenzyme A transporter 1-like [Rhopalosiphum maidis]